VAAAGPSLLPALALQAFAGLRTAEVLRIAMRVPRDLSANQLIKALRVLGYSTDHQRGSHIRKEEKSLGVRTFR
jgi:hypothetical protein